MIANLTPHSVNIVSADGTPIVTLKPTGTVARAQQSSVQVGTIDGIPVMKTTFGAPVDLPDPEDGVYYLVSLATANAAKAAGRTTDDLLLTLNPVRDADGRIIGCTALGAV